MINKNKHLKELKRSRILETRDLKLGLRLDRNEKIDNIKHNGHKLFQGIDKNFNATRYHSLILEKNSLPKNFEIIAETNNKIIMGIAHKKQKIFGLQFHPESIGTKSGKTIFENFIKIINYDN